MIPDTFETAIHDAGIHRAQVRETVRGLSFSPRVNPTECSESDFVGDVNRLLMHSEEFNKLSVMPPRSLDDIIEKVALQEVGSRTLLIT